jgi:hypothetical protein
MSTLRASSTTLSRALSKRRAELFGATALLLLSLTGHSIAQDAGLRPGEAFATRFSGSAPDQSGQSVIDVQGAVGSIIDLRSPRQPAQGQHWLDEPQRAQLIAGDVGQVFGVAFDDASPPSIYVTATAAFGLHRNADNSDWMPGMFGEGGPGAIYKLDAATGYKPQLFATITLDGRQNSGAALGNITYDRWNKQLLVSDLETGMIHRLGLDGRDLGSYDHGTQGRANFVDGQTGEQQSLAPVAFDPSSQARIADCGQKFDNTPDCWNVASSGRRVWGLGVWRGPGGETRLFYSVASSPEFGNDSWNELPDDEKRNALWSVRLGPGGDFDPSSVRREFLLPDFFVSAEDVARAGFSRPVSDITFPACSGRPVMLVAERGGLRNLGLDQDNAFATPHESRTIRYELDQSGTWRAMGRYDIGMYDRSKEGAPYINANCAGGVAFGPGYTPDGQAITGQPDKFVWIAGDKLCSPDGPCNSLNGQPVQQVSTRGGAAGGYEPDHSEVHGVQGQPDEMYNALLPASANAENQATPANPIGPDQAYMIDLDINVDQQGNPIAAELTRNDATRIGDVAVYQICPIEQASYASAIPLMAVPVGFIHGRGVSHYRHGSHARFYSHWRWHSHNRWASHDRRWSTGHYRWWSDGHWRNLSPSHRRHMSPTHWRSMSPTHWRRLSPTHKRNLSPTHTRSLSPTHQRGMSPTHQRGMSPTHFLYPSHSAPLSPGHSRALSPQNPGISHLRAISNNRQVPKSGTHKRNLSPGIHNVRLSKANKTGHSTAVSHQRSLSPKVKKIRPKSKHPSMGMGGGMGRPKAVIKRKVTLRGSTVSTPRRIGPQMFRGGGTIGRR